MGKIGGSSEKPITLHFFGLRYTPIEKGGGVVYSTDFYEVPMTWSSDNSSIMYEVYYPTVL